MESDCPVSRGKVTQAIASIGEMASVVNAAPRPTDKNGAPTTSELRVTRSQNGAPYRGKESVFKAQLGKPTRKTNCSNAECERTFLKSGYILIQINIPDRATNAFSSQANAAVESSSRA